MNLTRRPRRLRTTAAMRSPVAETTLRPSQLIQVFFVRDGIDEKQPIRSMPGQYQHTLESIIPAVREAYEAGIRCIDLFGIPRDEDKDEVEPRDCRVPRGVRRRPGGHGRHLPGRVHEPRPLRRAGR